MSALLELAKRCEAATGPNRDIDALAALAAGYTTNPDGYGEGSDWWTPEGKSLPRIRGFGARPPGFTASIDAALTLVPIGWETAIYIGGESANVQLETQDMRERFALNAEIIDGTAATPALALTAAALRAMAEVSK